ncbi:MAG TPA: hypothetical protein VIQ30_18625 [Pseudonocardia sp.]
MASKVRLPRPCLRKCGRFVVGRAKVCDDCRDRSICACGRRTRAKHGTCDHCLPQPPPGGPQGRIEWVPNGHGIVVTKHLFVARR